MNEEELLHNVKTRLRKAIASRLKIPRDKYEASYQIQLDVDKLLTTVMCVGYNGGDIDASVSELCIARHYGEEDDPAVIKKMRTHVLGVRNTLHEEVTIFLMMHRLNQTGSDPEKIWAVINAGIVVHRDYD